MCKFGEALTGFGKSVKVRSIQDTGKLTLEIGGVARAEFRVMQHRTLNSDEN